LTRVSGIAYINDIGNYDLGDGMARINITDEDGDRTGHFDPEKSETWQQDKDWDGSNWVGVATGSQWVDEWLHRTAGGKWVLNTDAHRYHSGPNAYRYITGAQAREWLLKNQHDDAAERFFGEVPEEEDNRPGRPEIGGRVTTALGAARLAEVDAFAALKGITRAEAIRALVEAGLDAQEELAATLDRLESANAALGTAVTAGWLPGMSSPSQAAP
jgi:hypothetical protein